MHEATVIININRGKNAHSPKVELNFDQLAARCRDLTGEFPEIDRLEITLELSEDEVDASGHATGEGTDVEVDATGEDINKALAALLDKLSRRLQRETAPHSGWVH